MDSVSSIFLWKYCFTFILSQSIGGQCYLKRSQKQLERKFFWFHRRTWKKSRSDRSCLILLKLLVLYLVSIAGNIQTVAQSSTDIWTPPIHVSDWLICCCENLIIYQERNENDKKTNFMTKNSKKCLEKVYESIK